MCLLIFKPKNKVFKPGSLEEAYCNNPDGYGFYANDGENIILDKQLELEDEVIDSLYNDYNDSDMVLHFRKASIGSISISNVHPIKLDNLLVFHNGTIDNLQPIIGMTDTEVFTRSFLAGHDIHWIKENKKLLEQALGVSRMIIVDLKQDTFQFEILNEHRGFWDLDGLWYSNSLNREFEMESFNN
jgi:predicted glutamine amidotransferase